MALEDLLDGIDTQFLYYWVGDNPVINYVYAVLVFLLSLAVLRLLKFIIHNKLRELAKKTRFEYDDLIVKLIDKIGWPFHFTLSIYVALYFLVVPDIVSCAAYGLLLIVIGYYLIRTAGHLIDFGAKKLIASRREKGERVDRGVVSMLANISKMVLWSIVILLVLSNFGYDTSALLTGLGIGGIAIALALQTVLSDIFAYFSIHIDKPFRMGDFIVVGSDMGTVEKIGIKTTRIRTLQGQELVVSNRELTESRINNFKKMEERRITFHFGIGYDTPPAKIRKVPKVVKEVIGKSKHARFDRAHFKRFGDSSLEFEVVYYMKTPDYNTYMDTQQSFNLAIKERLDKQGIEIPYPTQTVYVSKRS